MQSREIIHHYIKAYNQFDLESMLSTLHKDIVFENFSNGELTVKTIGIEAFSQLANKSKTLFSSRNQKIISLLELQNFIEVEIEFEGVFAVDLPNGVKAGHKITLLGKSRFQFRDGVIAYIGDYS